MLELKNYNINLNNIKILSDVNINLNCKRKVLILGPNGSGKSSLAFSITGKDKYKICYGHIKVDDFIINNLTVEEKALLGIFLFFQYPVEIPGINNLNFLFNLYNIRMKLLKKNEISYFDFVLYINNLIKELDINNSILNRDLNYGLSGGEKKINEVLQMLILEPRFIILDEIDSGLDIDIFRKIMLIINNYSKNLNRKFIFISHYLKILNYLDIEFVYLFINGKIVYSGNSNIMKKIEIIGFFWILTK